MNRHVFPPQSQQEPTFWAKPYAAALVLYTIVIWPILRADRYYIDDLGRSLAGYLGWTTDGRPLSNVVMEALGLGTPLTDISPLPQMLGVLLLAHVAVVVAKRFGISGVLRPALVSAPLVASPYFLENLSYKFDALPMALALWLAAMAALGMAASWRHFMLGVLAILASLCLYQPALNVFIVLALLEFVFFQFNNAPLRAMWTTLFTRIAQAGAALLVYRYIAQATVKGGYSSKHAVLALDHLGTVASTNFELFWRFIWQYTAGLWARPLLAAIALALLLSVAIALRHACAAWRSAQGLQRVALVGAVIAIVPLFLIAPWGPMLGLQMPVVTPRVMLGFNSLAAASLVLLTVALQRTRLPSGWQTGLAAVPVYGLIVFALAYGNTLKLQKEYEDRLSAQISDDFAQGTPQGPYTRYTLIGTAERPPVVRHNIKKYPLLALLVPVHLTQTWGWSDEQLQHHGTTIKTLPLGDMGPDYPAVCDTPAVTVRAGYRIYSLHGIAYVVLGDTACRR